MVDREEIAQKAAEEADMLVYEHETELNKIMAADALNHNTQFMDTLEAKISRAASRYLDRFNEDGTKFAQGYTTSVAGSVLGGVGIMGIGVGSMFQAGATTALGGIKNARAMDSIIHKARQLIVEVSSSIGELPAEVLAQEYNLNGFRNHVQGVLTGSVVHIQKTNLKDTANHAGSAIASIIEYINTEKKVLQAAATEEGRL